MNAIATAKSAPTIAARAIAMVDTAMFDAWAAYDKTAQGVYWGGQALRRPPAEQNDVNKSAAVQQAAYLTLIDLYPSQKATFDAL
ncbi:DUF6851 domain-containing protein, partial [Acinetobacter baumannii]